MPKKSQILYSVESPYGYQLKQPGWTWRATGTLGQKKMASIQRAREDASNCYSNSRFLIQPRGKTEQPNSRGGEWSCGDSGQQLSPTSSHQHRRICRSTRVPVKKKAGSLLLLAMSDSRIPQVGSKKPHFLVHHQPQAFLHRTPEERPPQPCFTHKLDMDRTVRTQLSISTQISGL